MSPPPLNFNDIHYFHIDIGISNKKTCHKFLYSTGNHTMEVKKVGVVTINSHEN